MLQTHGNDPPFAKEIAYCGFYIGRRSMQRTPKNGMYTKSGPSLINFKQACRNRARRSSISNRRADIVHHVLCRLSRVSDIPLEELVYLSVWMVTNRRREINRRYMALERKLERHKYRSTNRCIPHLQTSCSSNSKTSSSLCDAHAD